MLDAIINDSQILSNTVEPWSLFISQSCVGSCSWLAEAGDRSAATRYRHLGTQLIEALPLSVYGFHDYFWD